MFLQCVFCLFLCLFLTPGNTQNLPAKARGAHQPANDMQQCHKQAEEMSAGPTLQHEQVRNLSPKLYMKWEKPSGCWKDEISEVQVHQSFLPASPNNRVAFCPKVRAELRGEGARTNERHQDTNQRERKCVLWHGSISAKEKRVGTTGQIFSHAWRLKKVVSSSQVVVAAVFIGSTWIWSWAMSTSHSSATRQSKFSTPEESMDKLPWFDFHLFSFNCFIQICLQGWVWKVQALHDDNPDVRSNYLPLFPQLPVRTLPSQRSLLWIFLHTEQHRWCCVFLLFRVTDEIFNFLLVWYYCTLTIRESILMSNGSRCAPRPFFPFQLYKYLKPLCWFLLYYKLLFHTFFISFECPSSDLPRIKGWWVSHHYVSTFLSGVMLTWWVPTFPTKLETVKASFPELFFCSIVNCVSAGQRGPCTRSSEVSFLHSLFIKVRILFIWGLELKSFFSIRL